MYDVPACNTTRSTISSPQCRGGPERSRKLAHTSRPDDRGAGAAAVLFDLQRFRRSDATRSVPVRTRAGGVVSARPGHPVSKFSMQRTHQRSARSSSTEDVVPPAGRGDRWCHGGLIGCESAMRAWGIRPLAHVRGLVGYPSIRAIAPQGSSSTVVSDRVRTEWCYGKKRLLTPFQK